jgi:hypothetical protein
LKFGILIGGADPGIDCCSQKRTLPFRTQQSS